MSRHVEHIGDATLYLGDCLQILPDLQPVDMVLADIPFGTTQNDWDKALPLDQMWTALGSAIGNRTAVLLHAQAPFDKTLACSRLPLFRYEWVWEKTAATGHLNAKKMPLKAHEVVLVFYKKLPVYNPQKTTGHKPVNSYTKHRDDGPNYGATKSGISGGGATDRYPRSVLVFPSDKQRIALHPTQKPQALAEYMIRTYTNPGDTVLDFTMGSGTTGAAALATARKFIGIERHAPYFEIAVSRLTQQEKAA